METSFHKAVILPEEEENLIFKLCHVKVTAWQEESAPEAKYAVILFSCMCICMLVFTHLHVACGSQKIMSGFPSHFPLYLLKQGLLLNLKLMDSSKLATQIAWGFPSCFLSIGIIGGLHAHLAIRWVLGSQTQVLMFTWQELCLLNHLTNSHAVILLWENKLLYIVCPVLEINTSYT